MAGQGIDRVPIRWPAEYDPAFFDELFRETLALGDSRNIIAGTGVAVSGTSSEEATIAASADVLALLTAPFVTVSADAALQNERVLTAGAGITLIDGGPGGPLTIVGQSPSWGNLVGVPIYVDSPASPAWDYQLDGSVVGYTGIATANNDIATGSLAGDYVMAPTAGRVFAASPLALDIDASLLLGGSAGTASQSIVLSAGAGASPSWLTAGTDDRVLRQTGGALNFGQLTVGMAPDAVWTFAKLQNFDALSVLGRSANSSGVGDEIAAAADGDVLNRNGTTLGFGQTFTGALKFTNATTAIELESATPRLLFDDTNSGSNKRLWDIVTNSSGGLEIRTRTDADGTGETVLKFNRNTGTAVDSVAFGQYSGAVDSGFTTAFDTTGVNYTAKSSSYNIFGVTNENTTDGSGVYLQLAAGAEVAQFLLLPAATSTPLVTNGPTGAQLIIESGAAPLVLSVNFTAVGLLDGTRFESYNPIRVPRYTVATLPAGAAGDRAQVTDALAPAFGAAVAGGGAAIVPVYYTGAAWFVG